MYTLPVKELKSFFAASAFIPQSSVLPVLRYMKISMNKDGATLYRTDLESYYIRNIDVQNDDGNLMIEYNKLSDFVGKTKSEALTFTPKENTVFISDGKVKITSTIIDGALFPVVPAIPSDGVLLTDDLIITLKRAAKFLNEDKNDLFTTHVFFGQNYICASDRNIAHYAPIETPFEAPLYKTLINALPGACSFSTSENYYTFVTLNSSYLFVKPQASFFNMTGVAKSIPEKATCSLSKDEFLSYLLIAKGQCQFNLCLVGIEKNKNGIKLSMVDPITNDTTTQNLSVEGEGFDFKFNADYMITICKQFTGNILSFYVDGVKLFIHDENNNFLTIIMKVHDLAN